MSKIKLQYKDIYLKPISKKHISKGWLRWLNNPDINTFIEFKKEITEENLKKYLNKNHIFFLACYCSRSNKYFGNLRIYNLGKGILSFGRLIGDKNFINKDYGKKLAFIAQDICFNWLNAKEIIVGNHINNQKSRNSKLKTGFKKANNHKLKKLKLNMKRDFEFFSMSKIEYEYKKKMKLESILI